MAAPRNSRHRPQGRKIQRRVTVVQFPFGRLPALELIRENLLTTVLGAARDKPWLIVLPALTGLLPLHLYAPKWSARSLSSSIRKYGLALEEWWLDWAKEIASQLNVYMVPGSTLVPSEHAQGLLHVSALIDPAGRLVGKTAQTHIRRPLSDWGVMAGVDLPLWSLDGVKVGIMLGDDAAYPEVGHIYARQGAQLLVNPAAMTAPYTEWQQRAGSWQQAQAHRIFMAEANLVGHLGPAQGESIVFAGRSAIMAPTQLAFRQQGFIRRVSAAAKDSQATVTATLSFSALDALRRQQPLPDSKLAGTEAYRRGAAPVGLIVDERFVPVPAPAGKSSGANGRGR